jgi:hypothetical protein
VTQRELQLAIEDAVRDNAGLVRATVENMIARSKALANVGDLVRQVYELDEKLNGVIALLLKVLPRLTTDEPKSGKRTWPWDN